MKQQNIRNFCIIAHIDHGKSTLADRLLEITNTIDKRNMSKQVLDSMELEQEKGITIKLKAVRLDFELENEQYQLNLIDTPGHIDFSYEVSRSLAACEGAILIVDATQGIQAQTVSNIYKALDANLTIIPVLNKIDLESANVQKVSQDLQDAFGFKEQEILKISAKTGLGIENLLKEIIYRIPPPSGNSNDQLKALVFDTFYDDFLGVVAMIRIMQGQITQQQIKSNQIFALYANKTQFSPEGIGIMTPKKQSVLQLNAGEVGYISTTLKDIKKVRVGDTVTLAHSLGDITPLEGYIEVKPFVFVSLYPIETDKFPDLRDALEKLSLSDAALSYEPDSNTALGFGFRCGFLGLLHADITQERLAREYDLNLIATIPTVEYIVKLTNGQEIEVKNASQFPDVTTIDSVFEPWILLNIVSPTAYTGNIIKLCEDRRGIMKKMEYPTPDTIIFEYEIPLSELIHNFFDDLKTISSGFASIDYEFIDSRQSKVVKLDILVHGEIVEPLSQIVVKDKAQEYGKKIIHKLKEIMPRQQFKVSLQAAINGKILAREDIPAARKNVLAGIYGGHRERKDKLLERQKKGKEKMKRIGKVDIPQEAFRQILKT